MQAIISVLIFLLSLFLGYFGTAYWVDSQSGGDASPSSEPEPIRQPSEPRVDANPPVVQTPTPSPSVPVPHEPKNDSIQDVQKVPTSNSPLETKNLSSEKIDAVKSSQPESPKKEESVPVSQKVQNDSPSVKELKNASANPDDDLQETIEKLFGDGKKKSSKPTRKAPTVDNSDEELLNTINKLMK